MDCWRFGKLLDDRWRQLVTITYVQDFPRPSQPVPASHSANLEAWRALSPPSPWSTAMRGLRRRSGNQTPRISSSEGPSTMITLSADRMSDGCTPSECSNASRFSSTGLASDVPCSRAISQSFSPPGAQSSITVLWVAATICRSVAYDCSKPISAR